jgi:oligoribonuclease (3'-5' exoribonuclease)
MRVDCQAFILEKAAVLSSSFFFEKMTDKAAKEMVNRIRTPINKARSVKNRQEERLNDMDESLKE